MECRFSSSIIAGGGKMECRFSSSIIAEARDTLTNVEGSNKVFSVTHHPGIVTVAGRPEIICITLGDNCVVISPYSDIWC